MKRRMAGSGLICVAAKEVGLAQVHSPWIGKTRKRLRSLWPAGMVSPLRNLPAVHNVIRSAVGDHHLGARVTIAPRLVGIGAERGSLGGQSTVAREVARRTRGAEQVRRRAPPRGAQVWGMLAKLPRAPGPGRGKKNAAAPESFLKVIAAEGIRYFSAQPWQRWTRVPEAERRETLSWESIIALIGIRAQPCKTPDCPR